jgi:DNA-binding beta-propeller fold protein YncE
LRAVEDYRAAIRRPHSALLLLLAGLLSPLAHTAIGAQTLTLVQTITLPDVPPGPYADHMTLDVSGQRLFVTPQAQSAVAVLDLKAGSVLRTIRGFGNPHAVLYLRDRNRLFVSDGKGVVVVLDANSFRRIRTIPLEPNADAIAYDSRTGVLYVGNGGEDAGKTYSFVSLIDTATESKLADIRIETPALEAMVVDEREGRLYVNMPEENRIGILDLERRLLVHSWQLSLARRNEAFALDTDHHLLYVGCNEGDVRGSLLVVDTLTGKELQKLPLGSWVDSMFYDARRQRVYASTGIGAVFSYQRGGDGRLRQLESVDTAVMARTSLFSAELDRLFVMVPHLGWTSAKVLVFKPQ